MVHVYKDSIGVDITITLHNDLTNAASCSILVKKPSGAFDSWTPTIVDEATGIITYTTVEDDLDEAGFYILQVWVIQTDGDEFKSDAFRWKIYDDYEVP